MLGPQAEQADPLSTLLSSLPGPFRLILRYEDASQSRQTAGFGQQLRYL